MTKHHLSLATAAFLLFLLSLYLISWITNWHTIDRVSPCGSTHCLCVSSTWHITVSERRDAIFAIWVSAVALGEKKRVMKEEEEWEEESARERKEDDIHSSSSSLLSALFFSSRFSASLLLLFLFLSFSFFSLPFSLPLTCDPNWIPANAKPWAPQNEMHSVGCDQKLLYFKSDDVIITNLHCLSTCERTSKIARILIDVTSYESRRGSRSGKVATAIDRVSPGSTTG